MIENLQAHWGFTTMPFGSAIPVPALFGSAAHKEAVARLRWLISARGLGVLTGEVGAGKTVALEGNVYSVDPFLAGRKVELVFDPSDLTRVTV